MMLAILMAAALSGQADVAKLDWLAGSWVEEKAGVVTRETWQAPVDGAMAGVNQTQRTGQPAQVERMTIRAGPQGATFTAYIDGQPPAAFVLQPGAEGEAVFENMAHDFPQRVVYRRCGVDLCARILGVSGGQTRAMDWRFRRAP